jgi:D-tyrosyl-tRNA(Tyr) deacylase
LKVIAQRVSSAKVIINNNETHSSIKKGILAYVCFEIGDKDEVIDKFIHKIGSFSIFRGENDEMSLNLKNVEGELLIISQFTLAAVTEKGNKPSFHRALDSKKANSLYNLLLKRLSDSAIRFQSGVFGADMDIQSINEGPVTFLFEI